MSNDAQDNSEMATKPLPEHEWLQKLVGEWRTETEMGMPDGSMETVNGTESIVNFGGLWAYGSGQSPMPGGDTMAYHNGLGYDVTFKEYRAFMVMSASSHLWSYRGSLSDDGKVMTLNCEGPNMMGEGTAQYRDVIEIVDQNNWKRTYHGQDDKGDWQVFMTMKFSRA